MMLFRFAEPLFLSIFIVLAILFVYHIRNPFLPKPSTLRYSDVRLVRRLPKSWRIRWQSLPNMMTVIGICGLIFAIARPQIGNTQEVIRGQGVAIVLAVDISQSMSAQDFIPNNRLQVAKGVMRQFINQREFDTIGLVVFARNAFHQAPLTLDYGTLLRLIDEIRLVSELQGQRDGTAIGLGLASAINLLRESTSPSKVVILLTDGANNAGIDPIQMAQAARVLGIRVYAIGMGRAGLSTLEVNGALQTIPSDLDEETLQTIASITNGLYYRAEDTFGLERIYERIDRLERSDAERLVFMQWQDIPDAFIMSALLLLIVAQVLRHSLFQRIP